MLRYIGSVSEVMEFSCHTESSHALFVVLSYSIRGNACQFLLSKLWKCKYYARHGAMEL